MTASLLIMLLAGCFGGNGGEIPTTTVRQGEFDVKLAIPGELKAEKSVTISAPELDGQVKVTWIIEEGERVKEGDRLLEFDRSELEQALEKAANDYEVARTKIEQGRAKLAIKVADLQNEVVSAKLGLQRAEMRITDSETVPRVERENAKIDVEESTIAVGRSETAVDSARLEGLAEIELLRLDAVQSERRMKKAQELLEDAVIKAPSPGLVILLETWKGGSRGPVAAGDSIWAGNSILELPDLSTMEVEAWLHEVDAGKVEAGQTVSVVIDAHPEPPHAGKVVKVADLAVRRERNKKVKHLKVKVSLDETTSKMKPGMTVRAEVLTDHADDVLYVPLEAVFHGADTTYCWVSSFRGFTKTEVELGIANDTHVVIESGLQNGDTVALVDPERFEAGELPSPGMPGEAMAAEP